MGKRSDTKTVRNVELIRDYKSGKFTTVQLIKKYDVTATRMYEILNNYKIKRNTKPKPTQDLI